MKREHYLLAFDVTEYQERNHDCVSSIETLLENKIRAGEITSFHLVYTHDEDVTHEQEQKA